MTTVDPQRTSRLAALRVPAYRRLWWGGIFVFLAMQTQQIARSWLAYELTGTNTALGGVLIGFGVAGLIAIPTGGVLADRFNKRSILVVVQLVNTVTAVAIAVAIETETIAYWMLIVASVIGGSTISILAPARMAMTADLVSRDGLTNAIMLGQMSAQGTRLVGPAVAGSLIGIAAIGVGGVYYLSALLSAVSVVLTVGLPLGEPQQHSGRSAFGDLADGLRYARARPELVRLLTMSLLVVVFGFAHTAFLPSIVADLYNRGPASLGTLTSMAAIGAVAASFSLANVSGERLTRYQARSAGALGVTLIVFAVMPEFFTGAVAMLFVGASMAAFQALNGSLVLSIADMEYHGRVQSLIMFSFSAFGLAALPLGILADAVGLRETMVVMGIGVLASTAVGSVWHRRIRPTTLDPL